MKRRPPGWKARQRPVRVSPAPAAPQVTLLFGDEAVSGLEALLERIRLSPDSFLWMDEDLDDYLSQV